MVDGRGLRQVSGFVPIPLQDRAVGVKAQRFNIEFDFFGCFLMLEMHLRFLPEFSGCYLGSSRPSVDRALSALGCFVNSPRRCKRFNNAGKKVTPAIMHAAVPVAIT